MITPHAQMVETRAAMQIISDADRNIMFVDQIRRIADENRLFFGFVPGKAYEDAALQEKLFVAEIGGQLAGYLWFGGTYPTLRVFQIFVVSEHRKRGVGSALMTELKQRADTEHYQFIHAKILNDNKPAHAFYEYEGFELDESTPARESTTSWRVYEVPTPTLFSLASYRPLSLPPLTFSQDRCLLDSNIVLDLCRNRSGTGDAAQLLASAHRSRLAIMVSSETMTELGRLPHANAQPDSAITLYRSLPNLSAPAATDYQDLRTRLAEKIFPDRVRENRISSRDRSDISQILTARHHQVRNFITNDSALLRARSEIRKLTGVYLSAPTEIVRRQNGDTKIENISGEPHKDIAVKFAKNWGAADICSTVAKLVSDTASRAEISQWIIKNREHLTLVSMEAQDQPVAIGAWPIDTPRSGSTPMVLLSSQERNAPIAVEALANLACRSLTRTGPTTIEATAPNLPIGARANLRKSGWQRVERKLQKFCVGQILTPHSWSLALQALHERGGPEIQAHPPQNIDSTIKITLPSGEIGTASCFDFETMLTNVLVLFKNRDGVVLPIRKSWADELLAVDNQPRLFGRMPNSSMSQRVYFRSTANSQLFEPGKIIFFYESGQQNGAKAIVAIARCMNQRQIDTDDIPESISFRGVLSPKDLNEIAHKKKAVSAVQFDNVFALRRPVRFDELRRMGIADGTNFVTAQPITGEQVMEIWKRSENS